MRNLVVAVALCFALVVSTQSAQAAEPNLKALGLGSMKTMTQPQAKQVRGQGVIVWGYSSARVFGSSSNNGYLAWGRRSAGGANISVAGNRFGIVGAGGGSIAFSR